MRTNRAITTKRTNSSSAGSNYGVDDAESLIPILYYARELWHRHVQKHGENGIDSRLSTMLKTFLVSMDESGPAYWS